MIDQAVAPLASKPPVADSILFLGLLLANITTRLPFLDTTSFGLDPDAWRVALSARHLTTTGEYLASRFPGYPFHEVGSAAAWLLGPGGTNFLTAIFSGVAVGFFGLILRNLQVRAYLAGAVALAFTPVVFINSLVTMDYVWAMALLLGGLYFALRQNSVIAGIFLGLAIAARLTSGAMLLPIAWLFVSEGATFWSGAWLRAKYLKKTFSFAAVTCAVAIAWYALPLSVYGVGFLRFYDGGLPLKTALHHATLNVWGEIGFVATAVAIGWALANWNAYQTNHRRVKQVLLTGTVIYLIAYARLPLEAGYLIPMVPLLLAWLALRLPHRGYLAICLALVVSPFLVDLEAESSLPPEAKKWSLPIAVGAANMRLTLAGPLFTERLRTKAENRQLNNLAIDLKKLPRPALVIAGGLYAKLDITLGSEAKGLAIISTWDRYHDERDDEPLSALWPTPNETWDWPVYMLPGVEMPPSDDPRLNGRLIMQLGQ